MSKPLLAGAALCALFPLAAHADPQPDAATQSPPVPLDAATKGVRGKGPLSARIDIESKAVKGSFTCLLYDDKTPLTVANFVALARGLRPFYDTKAGKWVRRPLYDGTLIHRVIPNFMIQGGDPEGTGKGGPGYVVDDEIKSDLVFDSPGLLAMAASSKGVDPKTGHGTAGSQFFITERETPTLNGRFTIFGKCTPPELVGQLSHLPTRPGADGKPGTAPAGDIVIKRVTIQRGKK